MTEKPASAAVTKRQQKAKPRGASWPKGVSGNPAGGPKRGQSWREIIDSVGDEVAKGVPLKIAAVRAMYRQAIKGNPNAINFLAKYGGGQTEFSEMSDAQLRERLAQRFGIDLSGGAAGPISIGLDSETETDLDPAAGAANGSL